jgi:hypothetical protein
MEPIHHRARAAALMGETLVIEGIRPWQPRSEIGPEPTGEKDRPERRKIDLVRGIGNKGFRIRNIGGVEAALFSEVQNQLLDLPIFLITPRNAFRKVICEVSGCLIGAEKPTDQGYSERLQRPQMQVVATLMSGHQDICEKPCAFG